MIASVPSLDTLAVRLDYLRERGDIEERDYTGDVTDNPEIIKRIAKNRGVTIKEYLKEEAEKIRKSDLKALQEKYKSFFKFDDDESIEESNGKEFEAFRQTYQDRLDRMQKASVLYRNPLEDKKLLEEDNKKNTECQENTK